MYAGGVVVEVTGVEGEGDVGARDTRLAGVLLRPRLVKTTAATAVKGDVRGTEFCRVAVRVAH